MSNLKLTYMNFNEYKKILAINPSSFKGEEIATPAQFKWHYDNPDEETDAMRIGSAVHAYILEPDKFDKEYYCCKPDEFPGKINKDGSPSMADKENKAILAVLQCNGKIILYNSEVQMIWGMKDALNKYLFPEWTWNLNFAKGQVEHTLTAFAIFDKNFTFLNIATTVENFPEDKVVIEIPSGYAMRLKTRCDYHNPEKRYATDLKTTGSAHPEDFPQSVAKYGYHIQAAFTLDMLTTCTGQEFTYFYFLCCEKTPPYLPALYECSPDLIGIGRQIYIRRLERICEGFITDRWAGYEIFSDNVRFTENGEVDKNYKTITLNLPGYKAISESNKYNKPLKPF